MNLRLNKYIVGLNVIFVCTLIGCKQPIVPKPRSYFRIDFPEKAYTLFKSECNYQMEIPVYGTIMASKISTAEQCWYNLSFMPYKATIYLTYKPVENNLSSYTEDIRKIVYKHIIKADDIIETPINNANREVYGVLYDIKGNTASSVNFFITDSTSGFLSGSLYFNVQPNKDSLAPAIDFFRADIIHLINTFQWE